MNAIIVSLPFTHPSLKTDVEHGDVQEGCYAMQRRTVRKSALGTIVLGTIAMIENFR
jgi:hypothetical protein